MEWTQLNQRLYYLDYLRVFLTILLILHHTAIAYGAGGSWIYIDVDTSELTVSSILLTLFTAINQSFFLGLFFFISGYFTPGSFDRKGWREFTKDRLIRLGIPLLFYVFILGPIISYYAKAPESQTLGQFFQQEVLNLHTIHIGPLWFVETLLIFTLLYVLIRLIGKEISIKQPIRFPSSKILSIIALVFGLIAFLIRLISPVGEGVLGLQWAYFPMYVGLFYAGTIAFRNDWLSAITPKLTKRWLIVSLITIPILPIGLILTGALDGNMQFEGGMNFQSFLYAFWEPFVAFGLIFYLISRFRSFNTESKLGMESSHGAYTVYIIHPALVVGLSILLHGVAIHPFIKFIIVAISATLLCFSVASLLIRLPYARKVL